MQKYKIYYMIYYARKVGLKNININTNGTLLDQEMAEMLLDSGINFVSIDCDGFSKEVYEKIRIGADRDVTYENIESERIACGNAVGVLLITWDGQAVDCVMDVDA